MASRLRWWGAVVASASGALGCAPSLSTLQPAHVARPGHVQGHLGFDVSVPTGTVARAVDAAEPLADAAQSRPLTDEEKRTVFGAGANLAANPPGVASTIGVAVGIVRRFEIGGRLAGGGARLAGRFQILERAESGVDLTVGLGVSRYAYEFPASGVIPILEVDDFTRWTVDLPILFGSSGNYHRLWGGPKVVYSTFDTAVRLLVPSVQTAELASFQGRGIHLGAQGGAAIGYKVVFIGLELTVAHLFGSAEATVLGSSQRAGLNSLVIHPSVALMLEL